MVYRDLKKTTQTQICFILREIATYAHTSVLTTDSQRCPRRVTSGEKMQFSLLFNACFCCRCENCVEMLFVRGSSNCVQCDTPLRKSNFRVQLFEDPTVDKEVEIRKKVLKIYNKRDFDFPSLREYNDYLEQVEDIVYNLTNNVDVENTKLRMEQYQRENRDVIQRNKAKLTREQEELEELLLQEQQSNEQRRLEVLQEEQRQLQAKRKNKQALLDELEQSQLPATLLLAQHKVRAAQLETQIEQQKQAVKPTSLFSTGIHMRQTVSLQPVTKIEDVLYHYRPLQVETYGPPVPELEQLGRLGYLNHVRAAVTQDTAGGYTSGLACYRAIQDAFSGLFPLRG
uniref:Cdk-activating kinase assembly factor MAT1 centre domain-containing protein n=1 Tax=Astatotilapia calliptera TaxID=8154 RepID=A0AAX7TRK8_ASTCA